MADLVLVHGTTQSPAGFGPLVAALAGHGHRALAPGLSTEADAGIAEHVTHLAAQLPDDVARPVVLAHSGAGHLLPALARALNAVHQIWLAAAIPDYRGRRSMLAELQDSDFAAFNPEWIGIDPTTDSAMATYFLFHDADLAGLRHGLETLARTDLTTVFHETPPDDPARISSSYLLPTDDRTLRPAWMAATARERLGIEPVELAGGHNLYTASPQQVAGAITAEVDRHGPTADRRGPARDLG